MLFRMILSYKIGSPNKTVWRKTWLVQLVVRGKTSAMRFVRTAASSCLALAGANGRRRGSTRVRRAGWLVWEREWARTRDK